MKVPSPVAEGTLTPETGSQEERWTMGKGPFHDRFTSPDKRSLIYDAQTGASFTLSAGVLDYQPVRKTVSSPHCGRPAGRGGARWGVLWPSETRRA